mmetsp:Transcript_20071/g.9308  ORF Transcript_20071/g.9308 Transcript_20071/m.9308 type:complete len:104 (-) Transcript_20071:512-823(-)
METKSSVVVGGGGNGAAYETLVRHNVLDLLEKAKVEYVFFAAIDNVLNKLCDPLFVGYHAHHNYLISSKTILREEGENIGIQLLSKGRPAVIEYTELEGLDFQ